MAKGASSKKLVFATLAVLALIVAGGAIYRKMTLPEGISINTKGQPTIGYPKARVQVVIFEEPKCSHCRDFTNTIFPKLKKEFIDTNKIRYTVIPVSFLPHSMPAAEALLCVYYADPNYPNHDLFFEYLDYMYGKKLDEQKDWATNDQMVKFAQECSSAIDLKKLRTCIDTEAYRVKVNKNTDYGKSLMGGTIMTPTLYVNGIEVKELSYDSVKKLILEVLEHEGVSND